MRSYAANGLTALASLLVVAAIGTVVLWALQRRLIYFPLADVPRPAAVGLPSAQDVSLTPATASAARMVRACNSARPAG